MASRITAVLTLAARSGWLLDLLGERRAAEALRALASSPRAEHRRLALAELDRLPEWLDLLVTWLDRPSDEGPVLESFDEATRLAGPYAQLALRTYLNQQVRQALQTDSPADTLWALSLRVARWVRARPSLGQLWLELGNPRLPLSAVPEALRDFARQLEAAGGVEPGLARLLELWPDSAAPRIGAAPARRLGLETSQPVSGAAAPEGSGRAGKAQQAA